MEPLYPSDAKLPMQDKYDKIAKVKYPGRMICLGLSEDAKLACGGSDGVKIWNMRTKAKLRCPTGAGIRGATTTLVWIRREDELDAGLMYGTQAGFLVGWKEARNAENGEVAFEEAYCVQVADPSEITGLVYDASSSHLAICNRNAVVQLFSIDTMITLRNLFSVVINDYVPKSIAFGPVNGESRGILVFGLHDGRIHTLSASDGKLEQTLRTGCMIGDADVNTRSGVFCIDDPAEGAALYCLGTGARVRTYPVPVTKTMRARQISFAEDCSRIVIGSDHGVIYVFDRRSGEVAEELKMDSKGWIQTITAMDIDGIPTIIAARPREGYEKSEVYIWKKTAHQQPPNVATGEYQSIRTKASVIQIIMFIASLAFIWQNVMVLIPMAQKTLQWLWLLPKLLPSSA